MLHRQHLRATRRRLQGIILELCKRCAPLTAALRMHQPEHAAGLQKLNLGAIVILTMIVGWPDWQLAWHQQVIDAMPRSHVLKPADKQGEKGARYAAQVALQEVMHYSPDVWAAFARAPLGGDQQLLWDSVAAEHEQGWASAMLTEDQVNKHFPEGWASIPTFAIRNQMGRRDA